MAPGLLMLLALVADLTSLPVDCPPGQGALANAQGVPVCHPCPGLGEVPTDRALNTPQGCSTPAPGVLLSHSEYVGASQAVYAGMRCAARQVARGLELRWWQDRSNACHERGEARARDLRAQMPKVEAELRQEGDRGRWAWALGGALIGALFGAWAL